uniref:DDE Tnp4 domain-containing protein n=1 Tax=Ditylenchus dipsaci TaxID=166011 RepID=A0A915DSC5_9BILA
MMKPFTGRQLSSRDQIFDYRLSEARRLTENCFGIMAAVHRVLLKPMEVHAANADRIIKECLYLADEWRQELDPLPQAELGSVA